LSSAPSPNSLLNLLRQSVGPWIDPHIEACSTSVGQILERQGEPIRHVHFPCRGVVSHDLNIPEDDAAVVLAIVGHEGAICCETGGLPAISCANWTMRVAGTASRIPFAVWQEAASHQGVPELFAAYNAICAADARQEAACHRLHDAESRLCRWMLHLDDRLAPLPMPTTHADLGVLAGIRRTTVTQIAGSLQTAGIIASRRGRIAVVDRFALEAAACACYRAMNVRRLSFERRFIGPAFTRGGLDDDCLAGSRR
jgi:hypothetical protein